MSEMFKGKPDIEKVDADYFCALYHTTQRIVGHLETAVNGDDMLGRAVYFNIAAMAARGSLHEINAEDDYPVRPVLMRLKSVENLTPIEIDLLAKKSNVDPPVFYTDGNQKGRFTLAFLATAAVTEMPFPGLVFSFKKFAEHYQVLKYFNETSFPYDLWHRVGEATVRGLAHLTWSTPTNPLIDSVDQERFTWASLKAPAPPDDQAAPDGP